MKTADIVIGETYRTTGHSRVIVLGIGWKATQLFDDRDGNGRYFHIFDDRDGNGRYFHFRDFTPGGPGIAVAKRTCRGWEPEVIGANQIKETDPEEERQIAAAAAYRTAQNERFRRDQAEDARLRARVVALTADMDTSGSLGMISISRGELRHLLLLGDRCAASEQGAREVAARSRRKAS